MLAMIGLYFPHRQFLMDSRGHVKTPGPTQAMYSVLCVVCAWFVCMSACQMCVSMCVK